MSTEIVVMPTGPKATPEAIEAWRAAAQRVADDHDAEVELIGRHPDGSIESHIIARPDAALRSKGEGPKSNLEEQG